MEIVLTVDQFEKLEEYFEYALVAVTDEEQAELVFLEKPLRDMLRSIRAAHGQILESSPSISDQP